ncbi:MAG: GIY-YIG nuclease family protein [Candidatus Taylorbacteria bacterium]|nr:GIY-YIG nuclease family protein [Candidatus Taylorbacteria bacterium]
MYYVYILQSQKDQSYYTGFTENLEQRIKDHNWHTASLKLRSISEVRYTKSKAPFDVVWFCSFRNKKKALDFEKYLKQGSGFAFARKRLV